VVVAVEFKLHGHCSTRFPEKYLDSGQTTTNNSTKIENDIGVFGVISRPSGTVSCVGRRDSGEFDVDLGQYNILSILIMLLGCVPCVDG